MAYVLVLVVAAAVGAGVYVFTLRQPPIGPPSAPVERDQAGGVADPGLVGSYVPVVAAATDWESRLTSALGLVIAVIVGAVALAASTYLAFAIVGRLVHRFAS
jgi:hypothetical protein